MATITTIKERISKLNSAKFQILCDAYLSREGYPNLVALGLMAGAEKTTKGTPDTYFCENNGKYVFAEYTTQTTGIVEKIRSDLEKCLNPVKTGIPLELLVEIVYCHTSSNINPKDDYDLKDLCAKADVKLTLIGIDKLSEDLFDKYHSLVKDHLGLSIDTEQIQTYDAFLKQHDANAVTAPLDTVFRFRDKELSQISEAFASHNIVLLCGPAGVGKTRLALEYAKKRIGQSSETFYCIHSRSIPLFEDISMFFEKPGKYFLFIDDANQLSQIELILELVNKSDCGFDVQIIASVRDYALKKVKDIVTTLSSFALVDVKPLKDEQIQRIVQDNYSINNEKYLERISRIADGNCRIAVLAAKVSCETNRLDSISDATGFYAEYYGKVLRESGLDTDTVLLKTAGIIAFLNLIHLDHLDCIMPILKVEGIEKDNFIKCLYKLHDNELVDIYYDQAVIVSEQCLSNYILKYVFCDKKLISLSQMIRSCFSANQVHTVHAVNTLINVFRNDCVTSFVESEICEVWNQLACEQSPEYLEYIKAFYPVNQTETLIYLKNMIEDMECVSINPNQIDTKTGKNFQNFDDDILTILGGFADTDNLEPALELYFEYYLKRPDQYMKFLHVFSRYYSVTRQSADCNYYTQKLFVKLISKFSDNWANKYICLLFLDISEELLKLDFSPIEFSRNGNSFVSYHLYLPSNHDVYEYRDVIWLGLIKLSEGEEYINTILNSLLRYGNGICEVNKGVVEHDSEFICKIILSNCTADDLQTCLVADRLQNAFLCADIHTSQLEVFLNSPKMQLYNLLIGPKWDLKIEYDEYNEKWKQNIITFIRESTTPYNTFLILYEAYRETISTPGCDKYKAAQGIGIALQALSDDKESYLNSTKLLIHLDNLEGINLIRITSTLFCLMDTSEVYAVISCAPAATSNIWEYSYFAEIPPESVNQVELQRLFAFLRKDNDNQLERGPFRTIDFVRKFSIVDDDVLLKSSEIVLSKKRYSPGMVCIYFALLFNIHAYSPMDVVEMFSRNIKLLEEIYVFLELENRNYDYGGEFLSALYSRDNTFLSQFAFTLVNRKSEHRVAEMRNKCQIFYNAENYIDVIDSIISDSFAQVSIPELYMPDIIMQFLIAPEDGKNNSKIELWITHYIATHSHERTPMICLFSALSQLDLGKLAKYLVVFLSYNKEIGLFEKIPLTPTSWSCSGSAIPLYSSWITHLESLRPLFHGIAFVEHKKRVESLIDQYREQVKEEEIMEVMRG